MAKEEFKKLLNKSKKYAASQGFRLNPKKEIVEGIIKGLIRNKVKYGEYYCPCRIEHTKDTICPCIEMRKKGKCLCGLFVKK